MFIKDIQVVVTRVVDWINQAENRALYVEGSQVNGGAASHLGWVKNTLLTAPTPQIQTDILGHFVGTGLLPPDLLDEEIKALL